MNPERSDKYQIIVYWSTDDQSFVAEVPELAGCAAHGATQEDALREVRQAIRLWIETAREFGDPIPEPKVADSLQPSERLRSATRARSR